MEAENEYAIFDQNGMTIEKSENFNNKISGHLTDIVQKSREILNSQDTLNSIEIFFEKQVILLKDNCSTNLHMALIVENNK
jgi:hypothetical protein